jgi:putative ABC transport system substrate-binding protein
MDTKRKGTPHDIAVATRDIMAQIAALAPDLVLLGDDNAANYIGNQLMDTKIPVVFWGVNGLPLKYGLLDSLEKPGHNVTGIYQAGYLKEGLELLQRMVPTVKTLAILSDDSETGRSKVKALERLSDAGGLPLKLVGAVVTNRLEEWQAGALALQDKADAFYVTNHNTLKDAGGGVVDPLEVSAWYLDHIRKPECSDEKQFVQEGMLCTCDDSGYNQAYEAMKMGWRILRKGAAPGGMAVKAPPRGPFIVNRQRARMLGIAITPGAGAEETIETALALEKNAR